MATNIILLDLNDLCRILNGIEVKCKVKENDVVIMAEPDVTQKIQTVYKSIGQMDGGHRVAVDGREYIDRIIFQTHLEEQILKVMQEESSGHKV